MPMLHSVIAASVLVAVVGMVAVATLLRARKRRGATRSAAEARTEAAPAEPPVTRLPPDVADLVGREAELGRLRALRPEPGTDVPGAAAGGTVVSITGRPGVGKTAVAVRLAHQLAPAFPDGTLYLDLQGSRPDRLSQTDALSCLLHALGAGGQAGPGGPDAQAVRLQDMLAGRRVLVVLDDAADAAHVRPLLPEEPGCLTLLTSRQPIAELPTAATVELQPLAETDALALLSSMAGRRRASRDPMTLATVARTCEHLPLALRIAGVRMRTRPGAPLVEVADQLIHQRLSMDGLPVPEPGVAACVALAYDQLGEQDALLFRRLALLPGPDFAVPVAAALAIAAVADAQRSLERLVAAHLLERVAPGRYRYHELVRRFAVQRLDAEETATSRRAARRRALSSYLAQVKEAGDALGSLRPGAGEFSGRHFPSRAQQLAALAWFERERLNLAAAVRMAADTAEPHISWRLAAALAVFLDVRGYTREWIELAEIALAAARDSRDPYAVAVVLHDLGDARRRQGHSASASAFLNESLKQFDAFDSPQDEARVLVTLGRLHRGTHKLVAAVDYYRRALAIFRAYGLRRDEIEVFTALGAVRRLQGRLEEAAVFLTEALELVRSSGSGRLVDDLTAAYAAENLGMVYLRQDRGPEAAALHTESLATFREIGARRPQGYALRNLGECERLAGRLGAASAYFEESLALFTATGDRAGLGLVWSSIGQAHLDGGLWDEAVAAYERAVASLREVGDRLQEGLALLQLGKAVLRSREPKPAEDVLRRAEQILTDLQVPEAREARRLLADLDRPG
jgi:tetratricopeptide (TPR) repeat protein